MINRYYGSSIYEDVKKTLAEKGLGDKVYVCEPNSSSVATMLQNGTCPMPCVFPSIESKYIVSPSYDTFTTTGAGGENRIHTFDFQNSMPVMLKVYFTVLAFTIPELEEIEACLSQRYLQPCKLSWTGLPKEDDTLTFTLSPDKTKDIQREGGECNIGGEKKKLYQSVIFAKVDLGVEIVQPYSQTQIDLDEELQLRLVKKIKVLDVICEHFSKRKVEMSAAMDSHKYEADLKFIEYALSVIPNVREYLRTSLKIPADCAQPGMIKQLAKILAEEKCSVKSVIAKIIEDRRKKEEQAAQQQKAAAARNEQITAVKTALELSARIAQLQEQIESESSQAYAPRPTEPVKQNVPPPAYPPIKPNVPFFTKEKMIKGIFGGGNLFADHEKEVKAEEERIRNSPEYRQQCAAIDEAYQKRVAFAEEQHQANLKQYHEVILPQYEQGFAEWKKQHEEKLTSFKAEMERLEKELAEHYATTQIVSVQYRKIHALSFIYAAMTDPDFELTAAQAASYYDQAIRLEEEERRREEEQRRAEEEAAMFESQTDDYYASYSGSSSGGGGIINRAIRRSQENAKRDQEMREEMRRQERMKKDYYNTPKCQRYGLHGKKSCGGCPIAHMCKH